VRQEVPEKEMKLLCLKSGGVCAFRGCGRCLIEPGTALDDAVIIGEMAHIVADSRQGPRGDDVMDEKERSKHTNLILLCREHHKIIDSQPRTFSVPVLRQMKLDHEDRIKNATSNPVKETKESLKVDTVHSTLLTVTHLPQVIFAAETDYLQTEYEEVKKLVKYPENKNELTPFALREKLLAFHDLSDKRGPFAELVDTDKVERLRASEMWVDAEGKRRYINLLNRSLYKHTGRLGVRYDPEHYRFYFPVQNEGEERHVTYTTLKGRKKRKRVVWQPKRKKTGEPRNYWWHMGAGIKFYQMAEMQWVLALRPERHVTKDSVEPLPSKQIGVKVTSLKAKMYNELYLREVHFWRDYLSRGNPRIILDFGTQSAIIDAQLLPFEVRSPGIPGDDKPLTTQLYPEDLFTLMDLNEVATGEEIDWDKFEDEVEEEYEDDEA
jgi:hypothetical protein